MMTPESLSAKFRDSFAYRTIKDRLPVILTKVIDTTYRQRHEVISLYGEAGTEDLKSIVGQLSELRYRMTTDKPFVSFKSAAPDGEAWKTFLDNLLAEQPSASWYKSAWLIAECYMYRQIRASFENSQYLHNWDPFQFQKEQAFISAMPAIGALIEYLQSDVEKPANLTHNSMKEILQVLMQTSLWGNQCDLSISSGETREDSSEGHFDRLSDLKTKILVNDLDSCVSALLSLKEKAGAIHFVMDNAGLELISDLCLAHAFICLGLAHKIVFHVKPIPWFVSDVTPKDFSWTLEMLRGSAKTASNYFGHKWHKMEEDGVFEIRAHSFWTTPYAFPEMKKHSPDLHQELSSSSFVIFKGDLNYRKLVSDLAWKSETPFKESLLGFELESPMVVLRTLKADVVTGLGKGEAEALTAKHNGSHDWMTTGDYAVIQFVRP